MPFSETSSEASKTPETSKLDVDADKLIGSEARESKTEAGDVKDREPVDPDKLIEPAQHEVEPLSTFEERLNNVPKETNPNGTWEGERGESRFILIRDDLKASLAKFGIDGICYKDAKPGFSPIADTTVQIEGFSDVRYGSKSDGYTEGNFDKADAKCADKWNQAARDGRTDWTPGKVEEWRKVNEYSWHECNDMKTMQLVPSDIHHACNHFGGVGEYKKLNNDGGGFDD